jgi:hypothetical protein
MSIIDRNVDYCQNIGVVLEGVGSVAMVGDGSKLEMAITF